MTTESIAARYPCSRLLEQVCQTNNVSNRQIGRKAGAVPWIAANLPVVDWVA